MAAAIAEFEEEQYADEGYAGDETEYGGDGMGDGDAATGDDFGTDGEEAPVILSRDCIPSVLHGPRNVLEVRHRLELYLGLCALNFDFLRTIADVYHTIKPALQGPVTTEVCTHSPGLFHVGPVIRRTHYGTARNTLHTSSFSRT